MDAEDVFRGCFVVLELLSRLGTQAMWIECGLNRSHANADSAAICFDSQLTVSKRMAFALERSHLFIALSFELIVYHCHLIHSSIY